MRRKSENIRLLCRTGVLCAVLCILALLSFPVGAIPFSCALIGVFLCGALLPPMWASGAVLGYLALGAVGMPVFSAMRGGIDVLFGITGGYLWGYPLLALGMSLGFLFAARRGCKKPLAVSLSGLCGGLLGLAVCYALGTAWFCHVSGTEIRAALAVCVYPFVPFDIGKAVIALFLRLTLQKRL